MFNPKSVIKPSEYRQYSLHINGQVAVLSYNNNILHRVIILCKIPTIIKYRYKYKYIHCLNIIIVKYSKYICGCQCLSGISRPDVVINKDESLKPVVCVVTLLFSIF